MAFVVCLPLSVSGMEVALGVMLALAAMALVLGYRALEWSPVDVPLLIFLLTLVASTLAGGLSPATLDAYRGLWIIGAYLATRMLLGDEAQTKRLVGVFVLVAAAVALYGIVQHMSGIDAYRALLGRRTLVKPYPAEAGRFVTIGFFPNSLTYAHSVIVPFSWALAATVGPARLGRLRLVAASSAALMMVALFFSTARGAWLAAATVIAMTCLVGDRRRGALIAASAAVLTLATVGLSPGLRAEARSMVDRGANRGRLAIYAANLELVRDHPVLGVGFGNYRRAARSYYNRYPQADRRSHAHNSFLQVAAEAGAIGLSAFCSFFGVVLVAGWRLLGRLGATRPDLWPTVAGAWLGVIGFLAGAMTQDTFADTECAMPMWFAVAVLIHIGGTRRARGSESAHPAH